MNNLSPYYIWECANCRGTNREKREMIDNVIAQGQMLCIFCRVCGFAPNSDRLSFRDNANQKTGQCYTINSEINPPFGKSSNGYYKSRDDREFTREQYREKFRIDPEIYLLWIKHGKPRHIDLTKIDATKE